MISEGDLRLKLEFMVEMILFDRVIYFFSNIIFITVH